MTIWNTDKLEGLKEARAIVDGLPATTPTNVFKAALLQSLDLKIASVEGGKVVEFPKAMRVE